MIQRSAIFKVFCAIIAIAAYLISSVQNEAKRVDQLPIQTVNLEEVVDGTHQGGFVYQNQVLQVTVTTAEHKVRDIQVVKHLPGDNYAKDAQALVSQVLKAQKVDLPVDSNELLRQRAAKRALLFAIQGALNDVPLPSSKERSPYSTPSILFLIAFYSLCSVLGFQFAGYIAFRQGNLNAAKICVSIEDIAVLAGAVCCCFALILTIM